MARITSRIPLPPASPGTERHIVVHGYGDPEARPKVYLQAGLHADELPGQMALHHLLRKLDHADARGDIRGHLMIVPVANPIGLAQHLRGHLIGRFHLEDGSNFNRDYPDLADAVAEAVTPRLGTDAGANVALVRRTLGDMLDARAEETVGELGQLRLTLMRLAHDADVALDLHCDDEALVHLYLHDDLWPEAADLSAEIGSAATLLAPASGGEPFDEALSTVWERVRARAGAGRPVPMACLSATVELRGIADVNDGLGERDADALYRFLERRGAVAGDPGPLPEANCEATPLSGTDIIRAPATGIICFKTPLGAMVEAGDTVAELLDPMDDDLAAARQPIVSTASGVLFSRVSQKFVWPGRPIGKVAGSVPLEHRRGHLLTAR